MIIEIDNKWIFVLLACIVYIFAMMYNKCSDEVTESTPQESTPLAKKEEKKEDTPEVKKEDKIKFL